MNAAAFETILCTWACFKRAQGVLEGTVTMQHHLLLDKGCLCAGARPWALRGFSPTLLPCFVLCRSFLISLLSSKADSVL